MHVLHWIASVKMAFRFTTRGDAGLLGDAQYHNPPLFASLGWGLLGPSQTVQPVKEKRTGTIFEGEFCLRSKRNCPVVVGVGARTKKIAGIKSLDIYALALYVDENAAKGALHKRFKDKRSDQVAKDQSLFKELIHATGIEKSLVLVITSGLVKRKNFLEALNERLTGPMTNAKETKALDEFTTQFDNVNFRKGLQISFTFSGNALTTKADGKIIKTIKNKVLSDVLLSIYLGDNPVSLGAKNAFAEGLAAMVC